MLRLVLDFGASFVNANIPLEGGLSPLLVLCRDSRWSAESISVLVKRGADVLHRDDDGKTCLHHLLFSFRYYPYRLREFCQRPHWYDGRSDLDPSKWIRRYSAAIYLLIQLGADIRAEDRFGRSVAYRANAEYLGLVENKDDVEENCCARGDIWDFTLAVCGYDISGFRRKAHYGALYTRQDFKDLWAGLEHLCPYYNDEENHFWDVDAGACSDDEWWLTTDSEDEGSDGDEVDEVDEMDKVDKVDEVNERGRRGQRGRHHDVGEVDDEEWWR